MGIVFCAGLEVLEYLLKAVLYNHSHSINRKFV